MSWWDPILDYFGGGSSSIGDAIGQTASNAGEALSGLGSSAVSGLGDLVSSAMPGLQRLGNWGGSGMPSPGLASAADVNPLAGLSVPDVAGSAGTMGGSGMSGMGGGIAESGGSGLLDQATDWAKKNPTLVDRGLEAGLNLAKKNSPAPATTAGYNASQAGNAAKTAVGNSMINQAPFLANNAMAAAKGASADAMTHEQQRLQQMGYKPGDAIYDSAVQQQQLGNSKNEATAWAGGQGQRATQEATGAGLLTPNLAGYGDMAREQNAQQDNENQKLNDYATIGKNAFDIWSNQDTAKKNDGSTIYN